MSKQTAGMVLCWIWGASLCSLWWAAAVFSGASDAIYPLAVWATGMSIIPLMGFLVSRALGR